MPMSADALAPKTMIFTCHAPHPDPRRRRDACGRQLFMGAFIGAAEFVTIADDAPEGPEADGTFWLQCTRKQCAKWNRFRLIVPGVRRIV